MKKKASKLRLHRETLHSLEASNLRRAAGAMTTEPSVRVDCYPTVYTECVSQCVECPQDPPSYWC
jgi:hypothetical protein